MEGTFALAAVLAAAACPATLRWSYRSLKAPFFLYLLIAGFSLACAATASCFTAWPPAAALSDLGLASFGTMLAVASRQLLIVFRLAGEGYD
jgi:hypothetical protein